MLKLIHWSNFTFIINNSDSSFSLGIIIGIIIGATFAVAFIFIIRLKHEEKLNKVY